MKFIKFRPLAIKTHMAPIARLSHTEGFPKSGHICDRLHENPPYGINALFVQCAFFSAKGRNLSN